MIGNVKLKYGFKEPVGWSVDGKPMQRQGGKVELERQIEEERLKLAALQVKLRTGVLVVSGIARPR